MTILNVKIQGHGDSKQHWFKKKKIGDQKNEMNTNPTILDQMFITTTHSLKIC